MTTSTKILLYGRTGSGKTAMIGELAEWVFVKTGLPTILWTADKGGTKTIQPYIDLGLIRVVAIEDTDPFIFLNKAAGGFAREAGKWVRQDMSKYGLAAFESFRSFADSMMMAMEQKLASGVNIGGSANISFQAASDGETLKVSAGNMSIYGVAQNQIRNEVWNSHKLPVPFLIWTSAVSKDEDINAAGKVLGPDVIGKAMTTVTPYWFDVTARIDTIAAQMGKPERHLLYLGTHADVNAGGAAGLGNIRLPLDGSIKDTVIEPASIVKALEALEGGSKQATDKIKARLGAKLASLKAS
jgi:hypothetical protein